MASNTFDSMMRGLLIVLLSFFSIAGISQHNSNPFAIPRSVTLNFDASSDFILMDVKFGSVLPLRFIFDTGSEHTILLKKEYADLLGVNYEKRIALMGSDLSQEIYGHIARRVNLEISNSIRSTVDILVLEENYFELEEFTGLNIDGIIGSNIFRHYILFMNNRKNRVQFIPPNEFKPPRSYLEVPISIYKNKPYINASIQQGDRTLDVTLLLDTGAGLPLLLYTNTDDQFSLPDKTISGKLGMGLGGHLEGYIGRIDQFEFEDFEFANMITSFQDLEVETIERVPLRKNGLLGNSMLRRFNYYIDYYRQKLYIKANGRFRRQFKFDKSGLIIAATGHQLRDYVIQRVLEDSPAAKAGLKHGDVIKRIEGLPASFFSLSSINSILSSRSGRKITLIIARDEERLKIKFNLKDLI